MKEFGLTLEQTRIMFSYQYHLVLADIETETNYDKKYSKIKWLNKWKKSTEFFFNSQAEKEGYKASEYQLVTDFDLLKQLVMKN